MSGAAAQWLTDNGGNSAVLFAQNISCYRNRVVTRDKGKMEVLHLNKTNQAVDGQQLKSSQGSQPDRHGIIIAHHGVAVEVLFETGERLQVKVKRRSGHVVGDNVIVKGEVLTRLPRRTELRRCDARGNVRLVGANIDVLGVVVAPLPSPPAGYIDRAIVAARQAQLQPILVANKCDLDDAGDFIAALHAIYGSVLPLFSLSAVTGEGLPQLFDFFSQGYRGFFVGTTGVGKSSLLNAMCPSIDLPVGAVYEAGNRGRNTTTVSTLHVLAGGGELVDTPGFNDFGLVNISADDLAHYFPGFEEAVEKVCRFRDCRHRTEPGCAVSELVANGCISTERYEVYLELLNEVEIAQAHLQSSEYK